MARMTTEDASPAATRRLLLETDRTPSASSRDDYPIHGHLSLPTTTDSKSSPLDTPLESAVSTSDEESFDDHRLPANASRLSIGESGIGGERGEQTAKVPVRTKSVQENDAADSGIRVHLEKVQGGERGRGRYVLHVDPEVRELLAAHAAAKKQDPQKKRGRFRDLTFTKRMSRLDDPETAQSPFRGFYRLLWLGVFIFMLKTAALSYRSSGYIYGLDILRIMFQRNKLIDCLLTDAIMFYGTTLWCVPLQKAVWKGYLSWNRTGWMLQAIWQILHIVTVISWTLYKDWAWIQTVFIVLHVLVVLMKQHSYAFYCGYLSEVYKRRNALQAKLEEVESTVKETDSPAVATATEDVDLETASALRQRQHNRTRSSTASIGHAFGDLSSVSHAELSSTQLRELQTILRSEIESCTSELSSSSSPPVVYPQNITFFNYLEYIHFPTVVYELSYPRQPSISWPYVFEKTAATFGVLGIMIVVSQHYMYPVVIYCNHLRTLPLADRLVELPWVLMDLVFPFMAQYLCVWYLIWELILNLLGELTRFSDRGFYGDWWNSTSWDAFARDWNKPVHNFLLRHVYHSSISSLRVSRGTATLITFFLSSCVHELVMWAIFKKLRGYLLIAQMLQLPLVALSNTKLLKGKTLIGNLMFWLGIYTGPSFLMAFYLVI